MQIPIVSLRITYLGQRGLQNFVECFHGPIRLQVVRHTLLMIYLEFLSECVDRFIQKVRTPVTHEDFGASKSSQHILEQKLCRCSSRAVLNWLCLAHLVKYSVTVMI